MTNRIEIYPKAKWKFQAFRFTGPPYGGDFLSALIRFDVQVNEEGGLFYADGNHEDDTQEIKVGDYFVTCGPYWDVVTEQELQDDFRIG